MGVWEVLHITIKACLGIVLLFGYFWLSSKITSHLLLLLSVSIAGPVAAVFGVRTEPSLTAAAAAPAPAATMAAAAAAPVLAHTRRSAPSVALPVGGAPSWRSTSGGPCRRR